MKSIYISIPSLGQEETFEHRLNSAVAYVKAKYPEYRIVTPKEVAFYLEDEYSEDGEEPRYRDYLVADILHIKDCDAIFMCKHWEESKACNAEYAFAKAIDIEVIYQI